MSAVLRVLLVNDSATVRAALRIALESHPGVSIVGEVADGAMAASTTAALRPNVVLMDVVMPRIDGYEATRAIMAEAPTPVVMISAVEDASQENVVLRALGAGALSIVKLPAGPVDGASRSAWAGLVQLLRTMAGARVGAAPLSTPMTFPTPSPMPAPASRFAAIGIVTSAGGPQALASVLGALSGRSIPPILLVQHMAAGFSGGFGAWLAAETKFPVKVARLGELLLPSTAYIAPEDRHIGVGSDGVVILSDAPATNSFRPSGDFLLSSLARAHGRNAIGVVLTGMGSDGARGASELHDAGGIMIAESAESAIIDGMPGAVRARGAASRVLALSSIPDYLVTLTRGAR